jgi:hypothetical protein
MNTFLTIAMATCLWGGACLLLLQLFSIDEDENS